MLGINELGYDERSKVFADPAAAREFIEQIRWQGEPYCPHCGIVGAYKITPREGSKTRKGLYRCKLPRKDKQGNPLCGKQFTVTVGTIFEGTRVGLHKWLRAIYLMCASKKGVSANQLHRELGVTYKTAWFMCHRVREAMKKEPLRSKLAGVVEADETYVGGKKRLLAKPGGPSARGTKDIVFTVVQRSGEARSHLVDDVRGDTLKGLIRSEVEDTAYIMTDALHSYKGLHKEFAGHGAVDHGKEYVRGIIHTNFAESFFSLLKRAVLGTYHHISRQHMQRYLEEFDFRWNTRHGSDDERMMKAIRGSEGKRLYYRTPKLAS